MIGILLLPAVALGLLGESLRIYGMLFTVAMLVCTFAENGQLLQLAFSYLWQVALCLLFYRAPMKTPWMFRAAALLAALPLIIVKVEEVFSVAGIFQLLGVSYMSFRSIQVLLDIHDGKLSGFTLEAVPQAETSGLDAGALRGYYFSFVQFWPADFFGRLCAQEDAM